MCKPWQDPVKLEQLAYELKDFLIRHELWSDVRIYFNGKALSTDDGNSHYAYNDPSVDYVIENVHPGTYFEYIGEDILCMSFEGPLYELLNGYASTVHFNCVEGEFRKILQKYGLGYELGNAWNLSTYSL